MEYLDMALKLIVGLSILNVWLLRANKSTDWRGGDAKTITEEFEAYGLPKWFMYATGALKCSLALLLLISIFYQQVELIAAYGIAVLMLGAVTMHIKIGDPIKKSVPALTFFVLSLAISYI
ncbi:MAG: DoxX family protein [Balneolales bacterium]|nr:DoxX family protein [Balneolales bacterium]